MLETVFGAFLFTFFFVVLKALHQINAESIYHYTKIFAETQISLPRHNTISQSRDVFTET